MMIGRTPLARQGGTQHRCTVRGDQFGFLAALIRFLRAHAEPHQVCLCIVALLWVELSLLLCTSLLADLQGIGEWRWIPA